jgi:small subunit ribosomal protein S1
MSLTKFGAFIQISEGIEGMVHVSDIIDERRLNHPQDMLRVGQTVKAQVLGVDTDKRQIRLGMKQLVPTSLDEYLAERKPDDQVSGRILEITGNTARVELGQGIEATCHLPEDARTQEDPKPEATKDQASSGKPDLSSLSTMLQARWKGNAPSAVAKARPEPPRAGQIRNFRITKLDPAAKKITVELTP